VLRGAGLAETSHVAICEGGDVATATAVHWELRGVVSHQRYVTRHEADALRNAQAPLGRPEATRAALIPIRKNDAWWALAQDERRAIFEERSRHIESAMPFLPAIARRLHHCRDLGEQFDFLTWFEFAPDHEALFDELAHMLRATEEWKYVDREVDVRLAETPERH
jgi:chlorite dismutase